MIAYVFIGIFTATTYLLGGIAREQVCIYMCPWPRIQGGMVDRDSLLISYRGWRGEKRGPHKVGQSWKGRGDCIDCRQCVAVCPTGIDIRNGSQLECIQCALCIDACNEIMDKVGRPRGLIAYDTVRNLESAGKDGLSFNLSRPRVVLYSAAIAVVGAIMLTALMLRPNIDVNVLHDRNPLYVKLSDGGIRNGYTLKLLNKTNAPRDFRLAVKGLPGAELTMVGQEKEPDPVIAVPADDLQSIRAYVTLDKKANAALPAADAVFSFVVTSADGAAEAEHETTFQGPER
jgi:cytochrome c oxidase accessory protein FixG